MSSSNDQGKKAGKTFPPMDDEGRPQHVPLDETSPVDADEESPRERKERLSVVHFSPEVPKEAKNEGIGIALSSLSSF